MPSGQIGEDKGHESKRGMNRFLDKYTESPIIDWGETSLVDPDHPPLALVESEFDHDTYSFVAVLALGVCFLLCGLRRITRGLASRSSSVVRESRPPVGPHWRELSPQPLRLPSGQIITIYGGRTD